MIHKSLFNREGKAIFPKASETGAVRERQLFLDGLYANREKMGKMAQSQLKDLFPEAHKHTGHAHGYRQRSMMSASEASSAVRKAFGTK